MHIYGSAYIDVVQDRNGKLIYIKTLSLMSYGPKFYNDLEKIKHMINKDGNLTKSMCIATLKHMTKPRQSKWGASSSPYFPSALFFTETAQAAKFFKHGVAVCVSRHESRGRERCWWVILSNLHFPPALFFTEMYRASASRCRRIIYELCLSAVVLIVSYDSQTYYTYTVFTVFLDSALVVKLLFFDAAKRYETEGGTGISRWCAPKRAESAMFFEHKVVMHALWVESEVPEFQTGRESDSILITLLSLKMQCVLCDFLELHIGRNTSSIKFRN